ncbi:MAG TPA: hypothetical protein VMK66_08015 [Myxococcales bacterium]|nr:hypothetical protein [Myxococcales bacterium]
MALLGLVVLPLLHAEEHLREEREDQAEAAALAEAWEAGGSDLDALAQALSHHAPAQRQRSHGHSHGPAGSGPHGSGSPAHLCLALHPAPALPALPAPTLKHAPPAPLGGQLVAALRYLVPDRSQGPPALC